MKGKTEQKNYRVGIYVRESRDDNGENYETIEVQRDLLIDFIRKNVYGSVCGIYMDDNVSGSAFDRQGLGKLKEDIISGNIDMMVLKDLSRLGRNNAKTLMLLDFLEEQGVRVITYDGRYDSMRDNDTVGIDTWYNERYIRDISRKIRASLRFKIERGEYLGNAPFGYLKAAEHKNRLIIDQAKAGIVKEIYQMYKAGYGYAYIAKTLNSKEYPSPSNTGFWNPIAIKRVLCNAVYTGSTVQGVSEKVSFKSKRTRRLPVDKWVITESTHEAIISKEEFAEVQKIRQGKNKKQGTHKGEIHLLKDIIYCGNCGKALFSRKRANRPLGYICSTYAKEGTSACSSHHINEDIIKRVVCEELIGILKETKIRGKVIELLKKDNQKEAGIADEIKQFNQLLTNKQRQQEALYLDKLDGKISEQLFLRLNTNIENRIAQLQRDIDRKKVQSKLEINWEDMIEKFCDSIMGNGLSNEMIKLLIRRITVYDGSETKTNENINNIHESNEIIIEFRFEIDKGLPQLTC